MIILPSATSLIVDWVLVLVLGTALAFVLAMFAVFLTGTTDIDFITAYRALTLNVYMFVGVFFFLPIGILQFMIIIAFGFLGDIGVEVFESIWNWIFGIIELFIQIIFPAFTYTPKDFVWSPVTVETITTAYLSLVSTYITLITSFVELFDPSDVGTTAAAAYFALENMRVKLITSFVELF